MTYKMGDVVRLKSGGVPMCVTVHHHPGVVSCTWLTANGEPKCYAFDERQVYLASDLTWRFCPRCGSNTNLIACAMDGCPITDVHEIPV